MALRIQPTIQHNIQYRLWEPFRAFLSTKNWNIDFKSFFLSSFSCVIRVESKVDEKGTRLIREFRFNAEKRKLSTFAIPSLVRFNIFCTFHSIRFLDYREEAKKQRFFPQHSLTSIRLYMISISAQKRPEKTFENYILVRVCSAATLFSPKYK